ncbi:MAG: CoA pyrophosphatase [Alphaproteobacteria bacterium]|jgi:8-oxo-dGTP pyrophosphatase MutT (NUDIX family)|nr:CoA pyrophosphatase [Alphaproteobacteria bacterium]
MIDLSFNTDLRARIEGNLSAFEPRAIADESLRHAAVAIVIVEGGEKQAALLLTTRPAGLRRHGGQYALPGGRLEEGETVHAAALRELEEELGLALGEERIMGDLDDYPTRSGFRITPVVVWGGDAGGIQPDRQEVDQVYHIPLADLLSPDIPLLEPGPGDHPILSAPLATLGHQVFAPTAAMLYQFREVALLGRDTRVAHYDQPAFAWK